MNRSSLVSPIDGEDQAGSQDLAHAVYWRVEGSLMNLSAVRPLIFFTRNAQTFSERWARRWGLAILVLLRPILYATHRVFATRALHTFLRGVSRDRLDLLGEEYFEYFIRPRMKQAGLQKLREVLAANGNVVLVSQGLDHVMRPLAAHLGVGLLAANRLEFRNGIATGRLLEPVIRPRGGLARLTGRGADGRIPTEQLSARLGFRDSGETLIKAVFPVRREKRRPRRSVVLFDPSKHVERLSVREAFAGKKILLIGVTGFMAKVWLAMTLKNLPKVGKIYLLIRRQRSTDANRRFEKIIGESPLFEYFHEVYGNALPRFIGERIEIVDGDVSKADLGIAPLQSMRLRTELDLIINSSGLTEFNPDLRTALVTNVEATQNLLVFLRQCQRAALLHLSTCYVVGARDGRVEEKATPDYTPFQLSGFDAEQELQSLKHRIAQIEARARDPQLSDTLRRQILANRPPDKPLNDPSLEIQVRKSLQRWEREQLIHLGVSRAKELGWPNTYTFTKSLAESLIEKNAADLPVAIVRPSIVESSTDDPFRGWNEGVNTSAPISFVMGTYFRQVPTNKRKCLDLIPVDLACRGITLIAAALLERRHQRLYQLATSASNPCDMGRSIELTSLAHRKHYRAQEGLENWLRARLDSIPVSKERYEKLSAPRQRAIVRALKRIGSMPLNRVLNRKERGLERVEKIIELYKPFILHNEQVFEADLVEVLSEALPPEEKELFGYDASTIDWWEYWINIHIPALRRWSYPLLEGRHPESRTRRPFQLESNSQTDSSAGLGRVEDGSAQNEAPWPYS